MEVRSDSVPVADPGFPRRGAPTSKVGAPTYYFANFLPKNSMRMKEVGPGGGRTSLAQPPTSANEFRCFGKLWAISDISRMPLIQI